MPLLETEIETAINLLAQTVSYDGDVESGDALRFTQAALNLAHVLSILNNLKE